MPRRYKLALVGVSKYQAEIHKCDEGDEIALLHEHNNPHDENAIVAITSRGQKIGYVARDSWVKELLIEQGRMCRTWIEHINLGGKNNKTLGVVLRIDIYAHGEDSAPVDPPKNPTKAGCASLIALIAIPMTIATTSGGWTVIGRVVRSMIDLA